MNSRERVLSAFERTGYDRIPVKHEGTPEVNRDDHGPLRSEEHGAIAPRGGRRLSLRRARSIAVRN